MLLLSFGSVVSLADDAAHSPRIASKKLIAAATPASVARDESVSQAPAKRPASPAESEVPSEKRRELKVFATLGLIAVILLALGTAIALLRSFRQRL